MIKPIQTAYNGRHYRSRIEARWALFFDQLGIEYDYEPEGYEVSENLKLKQRYLPDFYLPKVLYRNTTQRGWYIEVKPVGTYNAKLDLISAELKSHGLLLSGGSVRQDHHIELGQFMDDSMNFRKCEDCGEVSVGYGYQHAVCVFCGGYCCDKKAIESAMIANCARFEGGEVLPWPTQPQTDQSNPF